MNTDERKRTQWDIDRVEKMQGKCEKVIAEKLGVSSIAL